MSAASPTNATPGPVARRILFVILRLPISFEARSAPPSSGAFGQRVDHAPVRGLGIGAKLGQPSAMGDSGDQRDIVLHRKDRAGVRIEQPEPGLVRRRVDAAPVGEVGEAVVGRARAGIRARRAIVESRPSAATVSFARRVRVCGRGSGPRPPRPGLDRRAAHNGLAEGGFDTRRVRVASSEDRIEASAGDSIPAGRVAREAQPTSVRGPGRRPAPHGARAPATAPAPAARSPARRSTGSDACR